MMCEICCYLGSTNYYPPVKKRLCDDCAHDMELIDDGDDFDEIFDEEVMPDDDAPNQCENCFFVFNKDGTKCPGCGSERFEKCKS